MNGTNVILDSNIVIYFLKGHKQTQKLILDNEISISYITELELLGYWKNTSQDIQTIEKLFSFFRIIKSNDSIHKKSIELRRKYKLKAPDSIIGATALELDLPLITHDSDFFNIPHITTVDFSL